MFYIVEFLYKYIARNYRRVGGQWELDSLTRYEDRAEDNTMREDIETDDEEVLITERSRRQQQKEKLEERKFVFVEPMEFSREIEWPQV